ncbi:hypothetical protein NM680_03560 [Paracoccus sp. PS-1]|uniref:hypothetical protein n=1 Tax=unclassified Paracoccus (in: a-proteobacteria) TaxID=2688777 RepID=UPI00048A4768|nr:MULTISPECIES: hypothetical protein [unclassified Paracoccus (in: a-proteobacteria)]MDQ7260876.1 hypothetical protein [Paracoccus sp. PS1]
MKRLLPAAIAALALSAGLPATAQDWAGQLTPYVWATGLGGDLTPRAGAPTLSFDKSFSDVLEDLDGAFFLSGYARRDRLVILGDLSWSSSSREGLVPPGLPASGKLTQRSLTLLAGYRALEAEGVAVDLLAGARAWSIKSSISVAAGARTASPRESFVDPIVALRANVALAPRWSAILYADLGGFGAGSESTSQIVATANWQANDNLYISAGYRMLNVDYESGGTRMDVTMSGPLFGLTWRF